jgi:kinetochore protein Spc7/SPC105
MELSTTKAARPKRKSIAHQPTSSKPNAHRENATTDIGAIQALTGAQNTKKKMRGKSLGPGGIEALRETSGNTAPVC